MGLMRDRFLVYVQDPNEALHEHEATITHQDMLRGEKAIIDTPGGTLNTALALASAWAWASLLRQGVYAAPWQQFRDMDCQGLEKLEPVEVDPTAPTTGGALP